MQTAQDGEVKEEETPLSVLNEIEKPLCKLRKAITEKSQTRADYSDQIGRWFGLIHKHWDNFHWNRLARVNPKGGMPIAEHTTVLNQAFYLAVMQCILDEAWYQKLVTFRSIGSDDEENRFAKALADDYCGSNADLKKAVDFLADEILYFHETRPSLTTLTASNKKGALKWKGLDGQSVTCFIMSLVWKMILSGSMMRKLVVLSTRFWFEMCVTLHFDEQCKALDKGTLERGIRVFQRIRTRFVKYFEDNTKLDPEWRSGYSRFLYEILMSAGACTDHIACKGSHRNHDSSPVIMATTFERLGSSPDDKKEWGQRFRQTLKEDPLKTMKAKASDSHDLLFCYTFSFLFTVTTKEPFFQKYITTPRALYSNNASVKSRLVDSEYSTIPLIKHRPMILLYGGRVVLVKEGEWFSCPSLRMACGVWAYWLATVYKNRLENGVRIDKFQAYTGAAEVIDAIATADELDELKNDESSHSERPVTAEMESKYDDVSQTAIGRHTSSSPDLDSSYSSAASRLDQERMDANVSMAREQIGILGSLSSSSSSSASCSSSSSSSSSSQLDSLWPPRSTQTRIEEYMTSRSRFVSSASSTAETGS